MGLLPWKLCEEKCGTLKILLVCFSKEKGFGDSGSRVIVISKAPECPGVSQLQAADLGSSVVISFQHACPWFQDCSRCPGAGCVVLQLQLCRLGAPALPRRPQEGSTGPGGRWRELQQKPLPCLAPQRHPGTERCAKIYAFLLWCFLSEVLPCTGGAGCHPPLVPTHSMHPCTRSILFLWNWRLEGEPWSPGMWCLLQSQPCAL